MKKREASFTTKFGKWVNETYSQCGFSDGFEVKQTTTDKLAFSKVKQHQVDKLYVNKERGSFYKYPDEGHKRFAYDAQFTSLREGFIVIYYNSDKYGNTEFVMIPIDAWIALTEGKKRGSLSLEDAKQVGFTRNLNEPKLPILC